MKKCLLLVVLISSSLVEAKNIIWWNTNGGEYIQEKSLTNLKIETLNKSLRSLVELNPEILILGEYYAPVIEAQTFDKLTKIYSHYDFFYYSKENRYLQFAVFSKEPFEIESKVNYLTWTHPETEQYWREMVPHADWDFVRSLIVLKFDHFQVIPLHLAQPWSYLNWLNVFQQITQKKYHPVGVQLEIINNLKFSLPTLLCGDFNLPTRLVFTKPRAWSLFTNWKRLDSIGEPTFPVPGSGSSYPSMFLDQAFVNDEKLDGVVDTLKIDGSDHYPIQIKLESP